MLKTDKETGILIIPDGYRWCQECNALTPHKPNEKEHSWEPDFRCFVCGQTEEGYDSCPHCGWNAEGDLEDYGIHEVTAHICGWPEWEELQERQWREDPILHRRCSQFETPKCDCPTVRIIKGPNIFNTWSRSVYSMDCMNAMEWGGEIRCPICGTIFEFDASNC